MVGDHRISFPYFINYLQQEKLMVEEKYGNLQEEAAGKTKKLQKINQMYKSAKAEVIHIS